MEKILNLSSSWNLWTLHTTDFKASSQSYWKKFLNLSSSWSLWTLHTTDFKASSQAYWKIFWTSLHPEVFEPFVPQTLNHHPNSIESHFWARLHPEVLERFNNNPKCVQTSFWTRLHPECFEPFVPKTLNHHPKSWIASKTLLSRAPFDPNPKTKILTCCPSQTLWTLDPKSFYKVFQHFFMQKPFKPIIPKKTLNLHPKSLNEILDPFSIPNSQNPSSQVFKHSFWTFLHAKSLIPSLLTKCLNINKRKP